MHSDREQGEDNNERTWLLYLKTRLLHLALVLAVLLGTFIPGVMAQDYQTDGNCGASPNPAAVGWNAAISPGVANNLRSDPGTNAALIGTLPGNADINVLSGPVCNNGYAWYQVCAMDGSFGWTASGTTDDPWIIDVLGDSTPCGGHTENIPCELLTSWESNTQCLGDPNTTVSTESNVQTMDIQGFCNNAAEVPGNIYSQGSIWYCSNGFLVPYEFVCDYQYGIMWSAYSPTPDDPNSWSCIENGVHTSQPTQLIQGTEHDFSYSPFETTYALVVDSNNADNCVIINGSEIIAQELNRAREWFVGIMADEGAIVASLSDLRYYLQSDGGIDTFRVMVEDFLLREAGCHHSYYLVGSVTMDMSGLGNILYGYFTFGMDDWAVHRIADVLQAIKDDTRGHFDYPDDSSQVDLGRIIAQTLLAGNVTADDVDSLVPMGFVSST